MARDISKLGHHVNGDYDIRLSSSNDMYLTKTKHPKLSTGCKALDKILLGGIETGVLTHFYGSSGAGKSQLCLTLSVTVQQSIASGGLAGRAIYIDTENKFSAERILEIAKVRALDTDSVLKNIGVVNTINSSHQEKAIGNIPHIAEKDGNIKLVIVDSIINHYRQELWDYSYVPYLRSEFNISPTYDSFNKFFHILWWFVRTICLPTTDYFLHLFSLFQSYCFSTAKLDTQTSKGRSD